VDLAVVMVPVALKLLMARLVPLDKVTLVATTDSLAMDSPVVVAVVLVQ
jgi:hypothetical protein